MIIHKSDKIVAEFIEKYADYDELGSLLKKYEMKHKELMAKYEAENREPTEFEKKKFDMDFNRDLAEATTRNADRKKEIIITIKNYSQELLISLYEQLENKELKELVYSQLSRNNSFIATVNFFLDTGNIFEYLNNLTVESKENLLALRENDDTIQVDKITIVSLLPKAREYVVKSLNSDLANEKKQFCEERGITSETEFEFYKNNMANQAVLKQKEELDRKMNAIIGVENKEDTNAEEIVPNNKIIPMKK